MEEQSVVIKVEPSRELSELCGFPHYIEKRFTVKELLAKNIIDQGDIDKMALGIEIQKSISVKGE
jgi:hypothetical protein